MKDINDNIIYYAAHIFNPRIKTILIREQYDKDTADKLISRIRTYLKKEFGDNSLATTSQSTPKMPANASIHHLSLLKRARQSNTSSQNDIDRYLDSPAIEWDKNDEVNYQDDFVLKWYLANAFQSPQMAKAARALLAVPGAEVDVERLFCGGRDLLGIRRYRLTGQTMRILTLLKAFFQRQLKEGKAVLPEVRTIP